MTAPAIAQGPTPSPATPQATPSSPTSAALAQAKKDNKRVEIEALRSETGTFFADPDGKTVHAELSSTPIRVKKDDTWQPIDTRLIEKDGVLQPKASLGELTLSAGGGTDAVTYTNGEGEASLATPGELPKPVVKDNTATYPDAYGPGADLVVTVTPQGFRHDVVIRQRPAKDLKVRVPMRLPKGLKLGKGADKTPGVLDAKGKEVDDLGTAPMLDAAAVASPDQGHVGKASTAVDGDSLVLTASSDFLADPAITYPVTVTAASETWEGTGIAGDTHVSNVLPDGQVNAGLSYLLAGRSHSGTRTHRSYIRFNIHDTPLMGGTVKNADLRLHNYNSHTCSDTDSAGIVAHRITDPWTVGTLTWSNQPDVTIDGQVGNQGAYSATIPCPEGEGELYYSIEQMVQDWMDGEPDEGVRLKSPTETVEQNWRYYRSDEYGGYDTYPFTPRGPVLFIEYEPKPVPDEIRGFYIPGPGDGTPPSANEIANHLTDQADAPDLPALSEEQARALRENSQEAVIHDARNGFHPVDEITREEWLETLDPAEETFEPEPDGVPPVVVATNPVAGATNVPVATALHVTFDEPIENPSFVVKDASGTVVEGATSGQAMQASFVPDQPLAGTTTYTAEISASDVDGAAMTAPHSWSFTTGSATTPPQGLVAAYGLNEGSGMSVADSSGQNNTGTGTDTGWADGKYGKALSFNGTSSWVTVQDAASLRLTTGMTLSAWVNPASVASWSPVVGKELGVDAVSYTLYAANGSSVPSGWVQTGLLSEWTVRGTSPLPVGTWSHVALTYDGSALRLFVNGQQAGETPLTGSLYSDGSPLRIGGNAVWDEYFKGLIDEVRVYNRAQSATEIQTDMTTPIGQTTPPDTQAPTAPGSLTAMAGPGNAQLTWTASTDNVGVDGYRIHRSTTPGFTPSAANQVGSSPTTTFTDAGLAAGTYYYRVRAADVAGNLSPSSNEVTATVTAQPTNPGLVAAYGMEEGTGTTVGDSSGQNNTGAATDTTWTATGKHGKALSFNGTTSWVTVPHATSLRLTDKLTLSAWVRPAATGGYRTVLMKENDDDGSYTLYSSSEGSRPMGSLEIDEGARAVTGDPLQLNQWSHLALTYDGSIATLYVNGAQVDQYPFTGELVDHGGVLRMGGNQVWGGEFFSGLIDEVRIYNRVQTTAEIQTDMNTPVGAAAPASNAAQRLGTGGAASPNTGIAKLTVDDSRTVDGVTVTSSLTPSLTTWLSTGRDGEAKVEVELAGMPTKSFKAGRVITDKRLLWSSQVTAEPGDSRITLEVPKGELQDGEKVRWRARLAGPGTTESWTGWQDLSIQQQKFPESPTGQATPAGSLSDQVAQPKQAQPPTSAIPRGSATTSDGQSIQATTTFPYGRIQEQEDCALRRPEGASHWRWIKNSFNVCYTGLIGETYTKNDVPTGTAWSARISVVVHTYVGHEAKSASPTAARGEPGTLSRQIKVWIKVDQFYPGLFPEAAGRPVKLRLAHSSTTCTADKPRGEISEKIGDWIKGADRVIMLTSPEAAFPTPDHRGLCGIRPSVFYPETDDPAKQVGWLDTQRLEFRCDSSSKIKMYTGGCVLWSVRPVWHLDGNYVNDKGIGVSQTAEHIWKALYDPDDTLPKHADKEIPGRFNRLDPGCATKTGCLTKTDSSRRTSGSVANKNYNATRSVCRPMTTPTHVKKRSCDEYPFASTHEGVAFAGNNYSVAVIECNDNTTAGALLKNWYHQQRIIEKDPFWVDVTKKGDTPPAYVTQPENPNPDLSGIVDGC